MKEFTKQMIKINVLILMTVYGMLIPHRLNVWITTQFHGLKCTSYLKCNLLQRHKIIGCLFSVIFISVDVIKRN